MTNYSFDVDAKMAVGEFFFTPLVLLIVPKYCHDEFFINFNFFHAACLKIAISKCLGYGIVVGSAMIKIPQIIKVIQASSVEGLSLTAFILELVALTTSGTYSYAKSFPFSAWGENFFMSIQGCLLILMYFYYTSRLLAGVVFPVLYGGIVYVLASGLTPMSVLTKFASFNIGLLATSRLIQIVTNFRNGHTGQLSFIMVLLLTLGAVARIFTTIQETGDKVMLVTFLVSVTLNATLTFQVLYYWNVKPDLKKKEA
ncbi:mannose-P-dolichol utilization defect 1 protein-like [Pocillopora damicornis]|uniref:mannose-P-dolichol utilization defect 1 protein-like n=1 Tax=Pocillopora damicornis TaxID=46731 RepID=UPI000F552B6D|nr:mannose-P-dolichol utilization defect 1 protein-like [Pocillopora damicornis]